MRQALRQTSATRALRRAEEASAACEAFKQSLHGGERLRRWRGGRRRRRHAREEDAAEAALPKAALVLQLNMLRCSQTAPKREPPRRRPSCKYSHAAQPRSHVAPSAPLSSSPPEPPTVPFAPSSPPGPHAALATHTASHAASSSPLKLLLRRLRRTYQAADRPGPRKGVPPPRSAKGARTE